MPVGIAQETGIATVLLRPQSNMFAAWDEQLLIAQAKNGSPAVFDQLVEHHEQKVFRLAQNITRNHEDAEDVMQNAFMQAFRKLSWFRGDSSFSTWLWRITVNEALMKVRRRRYNEVSIDGSRDIDDAAPSQLEDWRSSPEQLYSHKELQMILATKISELDPEYRVVFQLRDVEGLSTKETARALSVSLPTVKTRLLRARLQLRRLLNDYFESGKY